MGTHYDGSPSEVRTLDAYIKLIRAAESITAKLSRHLAREGLTISQLGVLEALLHLGPLHQRDLGRKLLKSSGNITTVVDNLERDGLVERIRGVEDRRYVTVHLTEAGRVLIGRVFPLHVAEIMHGMHVLGQGELEQLAAICKKLGTSVV